MKKIIALLSITLFITSCSNKFSLQKRKYNKGFYFATSNSKNNETNTGKIKASKLVTKTHDLGNVVSKSPEITENINEVSTNNFTTSNAAKKINRTKINTPAQNLLIANNTNNLVFGQNTVKNLEYNKTKSARASDTNLIVLIILSIFPILCLIAVFLKDGKNITLNFWIDLLLHLTAIGEIIFALLVVLDIVNLA
ncbi:MAG: hypothetical protein U0V03_11230 [Bacteroidia bacterium]